MPLSAEQSNERLRAAGNCRLLQVGCRGARAFGGKGARRMGSERQSSTSSPASVLLCGIHRSHYVGLAKTYLPHVATEAALNVVQFSACVQGEARAATRASRLVRLMAA